MKKLKNEFDPGLRGHNGGEISDLLCNAIFVFAKEINCEHLIFSFWNQWLFCNCKTEFQKNFNYRGIKLIVQTQIQNIWLICNIFFFVFFSSQHLTDSKDKRWTLDWANFAKNMAGHPIPSMGFLDMSLSQGHVRDMSGTFPTEKSVSKGTGDNIYVDSKEEDDNSNHDVNNL